MACAQLFLSKRIRYAKWNEPQLSKVQLTSIQPNRHKPTIFTTIHLLLFTLSFSPSTFSFLCLPIIKKVYLCSYLNYYFPNNATYIMIFKCIYTTSKENRTYILYSCEVEQRTWTLWERESLCIYIIMYKWEKTYIWIMSLTSFSFVSSLSMNIPYINSLNQDESYVSIMNGVFIVWVSVWVRLHEYRPQNMNIFVWTWLHVLV